MLDELIEEAVKSGKEICVESSEDLIKEIVELVKNGRLKPTPLANIFRSTVNLYEPRGKGRVHVVIKDDEVCVHYDEYDPTKYPLRHLAKDTEISKAALIIAVLAVLARILKKLQNGRG